jgi:hypothetical protein
MEMHLQPQAPACHLSGRPFVEGDRVVSFLVRRPTMEIVRYDLISEAAETFAPDGVVACRWVRRFKPRSKGDDAGRALKLSAESLFLTLADPENEATPENTRLLQFLALMLERKRVLRPRGLSGDGERAVYEHGRTKQRYEVAAGELTPAFFVAVQEQLSVLVGEGMPAAKATEAPAAG